ncbi:MAG: PKD domain-containing protein [Thermoplasmata archaeon]|nr:PKD domain-containing protein [Thermoplasmata archaeon]MCI4356669.1 PKD domain-containing protein [Thermoplasmata archaeon]
MQQPGGASAPPVPSGVTVDLISSATHQVFQSTILPASSGQFNFSSAGNAPGLQPGWWGTWVPPQAHVKVGGSSTPDAILPAGQSPTYQYENVTDLTTPNYQVTLSGVQVVPYTSTIWGNVTYNGRAAGGAAVQLLDPVFNGFVLANNTTNSVKTNTTVIGEYSLSVPLGTWVLQTTVPGSPSYVNYSEVTVVNPTMTVNPVLGAASSYLTWGYVNQTAHPGTHVPTGGNVTLIDPTNGLIYSAPTPAGGFYSVGSYPAGFVGPGAQTFDVVLSNVGYQTAWYPLTVSSASRGGPNPHNVLVPSISPPAVYQTTLNFSKGFGKVQVNTSATLKNDSTFPDLANASVGQLWAQLALDWQGNVTFAMANYPTLMAWVQSAGPFFPAGQSQLTVNGTGFGQPTNFTVTNSTTCASFCGLNSNAQIQLAYGQAYNATAKVATSAKSYSLSFNFRHPTHAELFNYTVVLPAGYVLSAGTTAPAQTTIVPSGSGAYTQFTLVSKPSTSPSGTASLTIVKSGNVSARVNVTVANFTFSQKNVLNQSSGNYTVIVGLGENATFSGANSTFPAGTNGTRYNWSFGDSGSSSVTTPTTNHTYTTHGFYTGSLTVTSSGGQKNTTAFHVYASDALPTAHISVNTTVKSQGGENYVIVNWSTTLHFNATASTIPLYGTTTIPGVLSVAAYNLTAFKSSWLTNLSQAAGANPLGNFSKPLLGAGHYLTAGIVGGSPITPFSGWQYNLTLTIWDAAGHKATDKLAVLVRDTEKPTPVATVLNSAGKSITSITEAANHTAYVQLSATNSTDPHNGSITWFNWSLSSKGNTTANRTIAIPAPVGGGVPANRPLWLDPQSKAYSVNLTVTDRAGNKAWTVVTLTVAVNTSTRPVLSVGNLTAPSSLTDGTSSTVWVNVTNTIGKNSTANDVSVLFYLLPSSGSGNPIAIGGSPGSVTWYGYTNGTVNTTSAGTGTIKIPYNQTFRAVIQWNPARTGTWGLWVNATASNEFAGNYASGVNLAHVSVDLKQNPIVQIEEYGLILVVAVVIIVAIVFWYRRRGGVKPSAKSSGKSGLERGGSSSKKDKDDDEDDEP